MDLELVCIALVVLGIALLASALRPLLGILKNPKASFGWHILTVLVFLFIVGYGFFLRNISRSSVTEVELAVSSILFGGGVFVLAVLRLAAASLEAQLEETRHADYRALHDELTQLPNRRMLLQELEAAVASVGKRHQNFALVIIDFDRFKDVNDTLGHSVGDQLLQHLAQTLQQSLRPEDFVARLSGDEFAVLLPGIAVEDAISVSHSLHQALIRPVSFDEQVISLDASMGLAYYPDSAEDAASLLRCADTAMYACKRAQKVVLPYDESMEDYSRQRLWGQTAIRTAIAAREFFLVYQPKYDLRTSQLAGIEALLRWNNGEHGLVGPDGFVALSERVGLIRDLTDEVLRLIIEDSAQWQKTGVRVWVNLSAHDLADAALAARLLSKLSAAGISNSLIGVEITETAMLVDQHQASVNAHALSEAGIAIAIDDFGTGYSTLSHLSQFPVNEIKIDRAFVSSLEKGSANQPIIKACIDMAHDLSLTVTAEGVETPGQLSLIQDLGCDMGQGFFFDRPMAIDPLIENLNISSASAFDGQRALAS